MALRMAERAFWSASAAPREAEALAVFAPTEPEFNVVARRLQPPLGAPPGEISRGMRVQLGRIGRFDVCLIRSGVGQNPTTLAAVRFLARPFGHALLIGFAGGLEDGLPPGSLVRPERAIGPPGIEFFADTNRLAALGGQPGAVVAAAKFVADPQEKRLLRATTGARIVDLESAAFAYACQRAAVPFTILRAVSDDADAALSPRAAEWVHPDGRLALGRITKDFFLRPRLWRTMGILGRNSRIAAAALDGALRRLADAPS